MLAGRTEYLQQNASQIKAMLTGLREACEWFHHNPSVTESISSIYQIKLEDAQQ